MDALAGNVNLDPHSAANLDEVRTVHMSLDLTLDFDHQTLSGSVIHRLQWLDDEARQLILDTAHLDIRKVERWQDGWKTARYHLADPDPITGQALIISLPQRSDRVRITYATTPEGTGIQWLPAEATADGRMPFMFSQSQSIHGRSWIPMQDTPAIRVTYDASVRAPKGMRVLMSADNRPDMPADGVFRFNMDQPIAPYLMAIAAGDLKFHAWSKRSGVWAEPSVLPKAAREFEDTEKMIKATEALYGPYVWGRYDLLILPPSFPYGGMENPRLSFITPTVIVGDKSLVSLITHELAHSWSGNLVTNATWNDFWLNEGITSYLENRVLEQVYGPEAARMEQVIAYRDMMKAFAEEVPPEDQPLIQHLEGRHPDDAPSPVVYNKGQFFMHTLERVFGRKALDRFLKRYFDHFRFQTVTSKQFVLFLDRHLLARHRGKGFGKGEVMKWLLEPGLPSHFVPPRSTLLEAIDKKVNLWRRHAFAPEALNAYKWSTQEWVYFLGQLAPRANPEKLAKLDKAYGLSASRNAEIGLAWLPLAIRSQYQGADEAVERHVANIGRNRLIIPVYEALAETPSGLRRAESLFAKYKHRYHPQTVLLVQRVLQEARQP
jgi:aminopeptidase N